MRNRLLCSSVALLLAATLAPAQHKIKDSVTYAKTWDAAVEEARLLNVPIVVHSHGFYCGPCWGMHSAVLLNKKYIKFADDNTVEVISLSRLDEGKEKQERRAETFEGKDGKQYMAEFPNLTYDEMIALNRSKASTYNDTGKIPFTCIVDPHTLKELHRWSGSTSSKTLMETVTEFQQTLAKEHGKGITRNTLRKVDAAVQKAAELSEDSEYSQALKALTDAAAKSQEWPEPLKARLQTSRDAVIAHAANRLDEVVKGDDAKRELRQLLRKLNGTGLEEKAEELLAGL